MVWGETAVKPRPTLACRTAGRVSDKAPAQQLGVWVLAGGLKGGVACWPPDALTVPARRKPAAARSRGLARVMRAQSRVVERYQRKAGLALIP